MDGEPAPNDAARASEVNSLGIEAAAIDQALLPPPIGAAPGAPAPAPIDHRADLGELIDFAIDALAPLYPSLAGVYTVEVRARLAETGGRLLKKYDINILSLAAEWEAEVRFALCAIPLIAPTVIAVRTDRARALAAATPDRQAVPQGAPAPAGAPAPEPEPPPAENPLSRFGQ